MTGSVETAARGWPRVLPWAFAAPLCAGRPRSHSEDPVPSLNSQGTAGSRPPQPTLLAGDTLVSWATGRSGVPSAVWARSGVPAAADSQGRHPGERQGWSPAPADPRAQVVREAGHVPRQAPRCPGPGLRPEEPLGVQALALSKQLPSPPPLRHVPCHPPRRSRPPPPRPLPPLSKPIPRPPRQNGAPVVGGTARGFPTMTGPISSHHAEP